MAMGFIPAGMRKRWPHCASGLPRTCADLSVRPNNAAEDNTMSLRANTPMSRESFSNRERASSLMRIAGLDAIVASSPLNVYYLTGAFPIMSRFSQLNVTAAVLPADPAQPIGYVAGGFEYYAGAADVGL